MASPNLTIKFGDILETPSIFPQKEGKLELIVTNQGDAAITGPFDISLYASTNPELDDDPLNTVGCAIYRHRFNICCCRSA